MAKKKLSKVEIARKQTFDDMFTKLNKEPHICAVPRPTGFGKTCMATDLIKTGKYKNILYVYPAEVIKNSVMNRYYSEHEEDTKELMLKLGKISNVTMMTYAKLTKIKEEDESIKNFDLIIFDECHRMAAKKSLPKAKYLMEVNIKAHIIGLTATPNRSDGYDVIEKLFRGITVYPYTLHDAFRDGIYEVPYYCYLHTPEKDLPNSILESAFMAGEDIDDLKVTKVLKRRALEIADLCVMERAIKETCDEVVDTNYMKFICFFSTHDNLLRLSKDVESWFQKAYPDHSIKTLEITSRKSDIADNVNKLSELCYREKGIDLILSVDMLNMGYHVDDITGIIMYRSTRSDIIYPQQYGRVLASGNTKDHIIFDIVDNIHRSAIFNNPISNHAGSTSPINIRRKNSPLNTTTVGKETGSDNISGNNGGDSSIGSGEIDTDDTFVDNISGSNGGKDPIESGETDSNNKKPVTDITDINSIYWYKNINDINIEDMKFSSYMATYREQIAKLVAEPMQMRCKEAFEAHFKRWCKMNSVPYPISNKKLKEVYNLDKTDFVEYFENIIKENKINYPMRDAEKLLEIGRHRQDGLPMDIFARWKNISVNQILNLLNI